MQISRGRAADEWSRTSILASNIHNLISSVSVIPKMFGAKGPGVKPASADDYDPFSESTSSTSQAGRIAVNDITVLKSALRAFVNQF